MHNYFKASFLSLYHLPQKHYPINSEMFESGYGNEKCCDKDGGPRRVMSLGNFQNKQFKKGSDQAMVIKKNLVDFLRVGR